MLFRSVYVAPFDVKIGNFLGGSINAITRSGTNDVKGSVYAFGRNSSLAGFNTTKDFQDYQTGFRIGLPLKKDKLSNNENRKKTIQTKKEKNNNELDNKIDKLERMLDKKRSDRDYLKWGW